MSDQYQNGRIHLDPVDFAKMVVNSHQVSDDQDPEAIVKRKLTLYLTAIVIAEKFNRLEMQDLGSLDKESYNSLIEQLSERTFNDW
ncbi:hypothetical protein ACNAN0_02150 [Agrilactobacillus fermenti]|uniref:hypothetical protein n=1 Tax=Agrilactobacillus fermenti TaxID=2586909 RepID=UPI001E516701|nr:hypothetical protein [Agrilactobacillus fermenti]MCD2256103.1 hypothetical protein [Agrilactobacillus fermenti]